MPETADLILKQAVESDCSKIYENLWRHEESARYMLWSVTESEEAARERMTRTIAFQKTHPTAWFVYEKKTGEAIGFAGMLEVEPGVWEDTGIAVGPAFTGRGYGKQLLNALTAEAKKRGGTKFICSCRTQNLPSHAMQLACGFTFNRTEPRTDPRDGSPYTLEFSEKKL